MTEPTSPSTERDAAYEARLHRNFFVVMLAFFSPRPS